jgi:phospholipase C
MSLDHIIILMLENNSFDRVLGSLIPPRADAHNPGGGIKGASAQFSNTDQTTGLTYTLKITQTREVTDDPGHDLQNVLGQLVGPNKGFVTDFAKLYPKSRSIRLSSQ